MHAVSGSLVVFMNSIMMRSQIKMQAEMSCDQAQTCRRKAAGGTCRSIVPLCAVHILYKTIKTCSFRAGSNQLSARQAPPHTFNLAN